MSISRSLTVEGTETIVEHAEPIPTERCLDAAVSLDTLLIKLGQYRFCFVGESTDPDGLITRYDLNKFPVYHQLYDQLAHFEIGLRQLIREHAPN